MAGSNIKDKVENENNSSLDNTAKTGDNSKIAVSLIVMLLAGIVINIILFRKICI